jgi:hypothetical protein
MFVFWIAVILIGVSSRLLPAIDSVLFKYRDFDSSGDHYESRYVTLDKTSNESGRVRTWLKRSITVPATFGYKCSQAVGWCTIPPRIQSLTILAFVIMNVIFCIHGYRVFPGNM